MEHKSFFQTHKVLTLLPLILLGVAVYRYMPKTGTYERTSGEAPPSIFDRQAPIVTVAAADIKRRAARPTMTFRIEGSPRFRNQVQHSLSLLWTSDQETYNFVNKYVFTIRNGRKTDFYMENGAPVIELSNAHAFRSLTWCAGVITHLAYHSYVKLGSGARGKAKMPPLGAQAAPAKKLNFFNYKVSTLTDLLALEAQAARIQATVLKRLGAPRSETNQLLKRAPRDFSCGHDGNYSTTL